MSIGNHILCALDEDKISVLLLLALSTALYAIDHGILLSRPDSFFLFFCCIRRTALSWFRSYLSEKKQYVMVQDNRSSTAPLDFGVP